MAQKIPKDLWRFLEIPGYSLGFSKNFGDSQILQKNTLKQFGNTEELRKIPKNQNTNFWKKASAHFLTSWLSGPPGPGLSLRLRENRSLVSAAGAPGTYLPPLAIMIIEIILKHAVLTNMCSLFWSVLFDHLTHLPSLQNEIYNQLGSSRCIDTNIITSEGQMFREVALYLYCICIDHHFTNIYWYITEVFL